MSAMKLLLMVVAGAILIPAGWQLFEIVEPYAHYMHTHSNLKSFGLLLTGLLSVGMMATGLSLVFHSIVIAAHAAVYGPNAIH